MDISNSDASKLFPKRIKVAFFDLDGTLVDRNGKISPASFTAIAGLRARGVRVAIATGRPYFGAKSCIEQLKIEDASLFFSGSLIINPATAQILHQAVMDPQQLLPLIKRAREQQLYLELCSATRYFVEQNLPNIAEMHHWYLNQYPEQCAFEKVLESERIIKLVMIADNSEQAARMARVAEEFPSLVSLISNGAAHPHVKFCNTTSAAGSRERAFEILLGHYGVSPDEVAAFGDAETDVAFLSRAGFGVALGNAVPQAKEAARFVTKTIDEDGVAFAIDRWLEAA